MSSPITAQADPHIGARVDDVETPALLVDVPTMERNVRAYAHFADERNVRLRSHVKTHKNPELARYQHETTGGGVCCQTLGEVEVMARGGLDDVYLSYQLVGDRKLRRFAWLHDRLDRLVTTVDHPVHVDSLAGVADAAEPVETVVEVDVGLGRTGVAPDAAADLAGRVAAEPTLDFAGFLAYEGHVKSEADGVDDLERLCHESMETAARAVAETEDAGHAVREVKVGGTATSWYSANHPVVTEINPGMYPFNDVGEMELRPSEVDRDDCAATVLATVISTPTADRAVVDAGSKSISMDADALPVPRRRDDLAYVNYSEEHGWLDTTGADVSVGDRIEFVVPHVCTTVNLHDRIVGVRDDTVVDSWAVEARGYVR